MKEKEITVLKVEPGKSPETVTMPNTLDAMQKMVGGYIEVLPLSDVCLVCNEDGKLMGLEGNRRLGNDIIVGTFFLAGDTQSGDLCSLMMMHLMAHDTDATLNELEQLRGRCVQDVMRTHGMISFKEIFRFQKRL